MYVYKGVCAHLWVGGLTFRWKQCVWVLQMHRKKIPFRIFCTLFSTSVWIPVYSRNWKALSRLSCPQGRMLENKYHLSLENVFNCGCYFSWSFIQRYKAWKGFYKSISSCAKHSSCPPGFRKLKAKLINSAVTLSKPVSPNTS